MALWDIAGKAVGDPVHKLIGGKGARHMRFYNGRVRYPMASSTPEAYNQNMARMKSAP